VELVQLLICGEVLRLLGRLHLAQLGLLAEEGLQGARVTDAPGL
jgi:hypothetical protein